jgi:hypothetical protein
MEPHCLDSSRLVFRGSLPATGGAGRQWGVASCNSRPSQVRFIVTAPLATSALPVERWLARHFHREKWHAFHLSQVRHDKSSSVWAYCEDATVTLAMYSIFGHYIHKFTEEHTSYSFDVGLPPSSKSLSSPFGITFSWAPRLDHSLFHLHALSFSSPLDLPLRTFTI